MPEIRRFTVAVKERVAPRAFQILRERVAPATKNAGVKTWALVRNGIAPGMKAGAIAFKERAVPKIRNMSVRAWALMRDRVTPRVVGAGRERILPAVVSTGRSAATAVKRGTKTAVNAARKSAYYVYSAARERRIARKYGDTASGRAAAVAVGAGLKEIHGLRIAQAMVKAGYRPGQAVRMMEELREMAERHPYAKGRDGKALAGFALIAVHDAVKYTGAHPGVAYNAVARTLRGADEEAVQKMIELFKRRMSDPKYRKDILKMLGKEMMREAKIRKFLEEAEPPVIT